MSVDHIVEIKDGGKHCLQNLQYLTQEDNLKKSHVLRAKRRLDNGNK
jgi:5-methylcytosine-specific restriction endonuclease McrA